ncbi:hypothetical protein CVT25_002865 [Psilocybe cyanescens]|uniref:Uncharacterized protein n=1 Tax=Psilocybe cyanescens TaxID=93625 RepID=A0A409X513_PSICY|nr:hypothetical protein CVT25_002865 [Psilocybe cyanescens]
MSPSTAQNTDEVPTAALQSREENLQLNSDRTVWGHFSLLLYSALAVVHTFGLHLLLYNNMACAKSRLRENSPIELDESRPRPRQDCEANLTALNSEIQFREQWDRYMTWLVKAWSIICTGCIILLPFPLGFFQIPGIDGNIYARTAVLSMLICSGIGLMTAGFYLQMASKFKSTGFMKEWMKASQGLNNRHSVDFWTCLCLPISLFS